MFGSPGEGGEWRLWQKHTRKSHIFYTHLLTQHPCERRISLQQPHLDSTKPRRAHMSDELQRAMVFFYCSSGLAWQGGRTKGTVGRNTPENHTLSAYTSPRIPVNKSDCSKFTQIAPTKDRPICVISRSQLPGHWPRAPVYNSTCCLERVRTEHTWLYCCILHRQDMSPIFQWVSNRTVGPQHHRGSVRRLCRVFPI